MTVTLNTETNESLSATVDVTGRALPWLLVWQDPAERIRHFVHQGQGVYREARPVNVMVPTPRKAGG